MPSGLRQHYQNELLLAESNFSAGDLLVSWHHLERAHILGQSWPIEHTTAHWRMMVFAFRVKNFTEIIGQIPRLMAGGVKSFLGAVPVGNTGGVNVPLLKPMEIPPDLRALLNKYSKPIHSQS